MKENIRGRWRVLFILTLVHVSGELSHFLIGIVTRPMSQDIHYGLKKCLANDALDHELPNAHNYTIHCYSATNSKSCAEIGTIPNYNVSSCVWDYSGLGFEYQILAGPAFIAVFTVFGMAADRMSRHRVLCFSVLLLASCTILTGGAKKYWHLILLRMGVGAGESVFAPACSSMIADLFSPARRGLALGIFNWGIYFGYGISYTIGNFITEANILDMGWRWSYFVSGAFASVVLIFLVVFVKEPHRQTQIPVDNEDRRTQNRLISNESKEDEETDDTYYDISHESMSLSWNGLYHGEAGLINVLKCFSKPSVILLTIGACLRHAAGFTWGYNTQQYYSTYYPQYNLGIWIASISIVGGTVGVAVGGFVSDKLMKKLGVRSRVLVLGVSQILATPLSLGVLYFRPTLSFYLLLATYLFGEMWFGVLFAILLELFPRNIQATSIAVFLFIMNNVGGNAPILVEHLRIVFSYRTALVIMLPGLNFIGCILFFCSALFMSPYNQQ